MYIDSIFNFRDCFIRAAEFDQKFLACGLADAEEWGLFVNDNTYDYDYLTFYKCKALINSQPTTTTRRDSANNWIYQQTDTATSKYLATYDDDARDYFQMATEICYLGKNEISFII